MARVKVVNAVVGDVLVYVQEQQTDMNSLTSHVKLLDLHVYVQQQPGL